LKVSFLDLNEITAFVLAVTVDPVHKEEKADIIPISSLLTENAFLLIHDMSRAFSTDAWNESFLPNCSSATIQTINLTTLDFHDRLATIVRPVNPYEFACHECIPPRLK